MEFKKHALLKKYLNDFEDEHPLLVAFDLHPEYMDYVENLLKEVEGISNLEMKIIEMKDSGNWESSFSELEFIRKIKDLKPEFIRPTKGTRTPDIEATIFDEKVFFEVKLLMENDETRRLYAEIWKVESNLVVRVTYDALDESKTDSLIKFIVNKVNKKEQGSFLHEGTDIEISEKKAPTTKRTAVITLHRPIIIPFEPIRKKIFMDFYDKLTQFESCTPIFWVVDCNRWKYNLDDFKSIFYGTITTDATIAKFLPGFSSLIPSVKNIELFNGTCLIPILTYPNKDGLFFLKESECLNGIIAKTHGAFDSVINPFAKHQLKIESIRLLKKLLSG